MQVYQESLIQDEDSEPIQHFELIAQYIQVSQSYVIINYLAYVYLIIKPFGEKTMKFYFSTLP